MPEGIARRIRPRPEVCLEHPETLSSARLNHFVLYVVFPSLVAFPRNRIARHRASPHSRPLPMATCTLICPSVQGQKYHPRSLKKKTKHKDCTLFAWSFGGRLDITVSSAQQQGRSSGSRIIPQPRLPITLRAQQWLMWLESPFTAAGPLPILTGFPF